MLFEHGREGNPHISCKIHLMDLHPAVSAGQSASIVVRFVGFFPVGWSVCLQLIHLFGDTPLDGCCILRLWWLWFCANWDREIRHLSHRALRHLQSTWCVVSQKQTKCRKVMSGLSVKQVSKILPSSLLLQLCCCRRTPVYTCCVMVVLEVRISHWIRNSENSWEVHLSPRGPDSKAKSPLSLVDFDLLPKASSLARFPLAFPLSGGERRAPEIEGKGKIPRLERKDSIICTAGRKVCFFPESQSTRGLKSYLCRIPVGQKALFFLLMRGYPQLVSQLIRTFHTLWTDWLLRWIICFKHSLVCFTIHYSVGSIYHLWEASTYSFSFMFHIKGFCIFISWL